MPNSPPEWMHGEPPPRFGNILRTWEGYLTQVKSWPDSAANKTVAMQEAEEMIARTKVETG